VTLTDFPDAAVIENRLRRFEDHFIDALIRRYRSLPSHVDRLSVVSVAIHLQSRPRRTVSLYQYLCGGIGNQHSEAASAAADGAVPVELLDPNGDNTGEYIVTIPDGQFHAVRLARLQLANRSAAGAASERREVVGDVSSEDLELWSRLGEDIVRCVAFEAGRELARMFEYQIGLLAEDTGIRMLADHAVECAAAYIERQVTAAPSSQQQSQAAVSSSSAAMRTTQPQRTTSGRRGGVWERNSVVRGAVFGAVFGHTETSVAPMTVEFDVPRVTNGDVGGPRNGGTHRVVAVRRPAGRQVSVVIGQRELKWDVGDILKRPGLRRDRLLYAADLSVVENGPPSPPPPFNGANRKHNNRQPHHSSISGIDAKQSAKTDRQHDAPGTGRSDLGGGSMCQLPSLASASRPAAADPGGLRRTGSDMASTSSHSASSVHSPWTFHVSAACDARLYGYRGPLLDWDYFANVYAPVPDDEGWFDQQAPPNDDDFHRLYRPRRCLVGTELMQAYCNGSSGSAAAGESHSGRHSRPPRPVFRTSSADKSSTLADFVAARIGETAAATTTGGSPSSSRIVPVYRPLKAMSLGTAPRLRRADLASADLTRVRLVGADLRRTGLRSCTLAFARLTGVRFGSATGPLTNGCDLSYAVLDDVEMPPGFRLVGEDRPSSLMTSSTADAAAASSTAIRAVYTVVGTTVCINSPDGASDDTDVLMHTGSKHLTVCAPNAGVMSIDDCKYQLRQIT
jgi:hypothetical protein